MKLKKEFFGSILIGTAFSEDKFGWNSIYEHDSLNGTLKETSSKMLKIIMLIEASTISLRLNKLSL